MQDHMQNAKETPWGRPVDVSATDWVLALDISTIEVCWVFCVPFLAWKKSTTGPHEGWPALERFLDWPLCVDACFSSACLGNCRVVGGGESDVSLAASCRITRLTSVWSSWDSLGLHIGILPCFFHLTCMIMIMYVFDWVLHSFWLDRRDEKMKMIEDDSF